MSLQAIEGEKIGWQMCTVECCLNNAVRQRSVYWCFDSAITGLKWENHIRKHHCIAVIQMEIPSDSLFHSILAWKCRFLNVECVGVTFALPAHSKSYMQPHRVCTCEVYKSICASVCIFVVGCQWENELTESKSEIWQIPSRKISYWFGPTEDQTSKNTWIITL